MDTSMDAPEPKGLDREELDHLLDRVQGGVVARPQLVGLGARDHEIARLLRRRELVPVHRGVYVNHTGPLSWDQRACAAALVHWPAALTRESALPTPVKQGPIHVAIALHRTVAPVRGVVAHRTHDFEARADWIRVPPKITFEHAVIDVASARRADPLAMFRTLADACQTRLTWASKLIEVLEKRARVPGKTLMLEMLADLATGACSVLEREYLHAVERAHGLPEPNRQKPAQTNGRSAYRDADYQAYGLLVELDGRAFHDNATSRDKDADRDLDARVDEDRTTVRLTYGLVFGDPCRTAQRLAVLLQRGGWTGTPTRCPRCPGS